MTLTQMLTDLEGRIGSEPEITTTTLTTWINQGLLTFCNSHNYHWLQKTAKASTVASQEKYIQPTDCKTMIEIKIDGDRYQYVRFEQRDIQSADKKYFTVLNNTLYINPIPATTGSANIDMAYYRRPTKMTADAESPSDATISGLPEVYHEAMVLYAFSIYNTYDEEHGEAQSLMGNEFRPLPGTFNFFIRLAKTEEQQRKKGGRNRFLSSKEYYGYRHPGRIGNNNTVLGN